MDEERCYWFDGVEKGGVVLFGGEGNCFQVLASRLAAEINKGQE
jgi:hypothetical protein